MWKPPGKVEGKASGGNECCWSPLTCSALWQEPDPDSAGCQHLWGVSEMLWCGVRCKPWVGNVGQQHSAGGSWFLTNLLAEPFPESNKGPSKSSISSAFNLQHPGIAPRDTTAGEKPNFCVYEPIFIWLGLVVYWVDFYLSFLLSKYTRNLLFRFLLTEFPLLSHTGEKPVGFQIKQGNNTLFSSTISPDCYS